MLFLMDENGVLCEVRTESVCRPVRTFEDLSTFKLLTAT